LTAHVGEEGGQIFRDFLVSNEVFGVVSGVELGNKVTAGLVNLVDGSWELEIFFL